MFFMTLQTPIHPRFVDLHIDPSPYITYYQTRLDLNGYQIISVESDGSFDVKIIDNLVNWKSEGQLPDGRKLQGVFLITQNLNSAIQIYHQVIDMGIDDVFYLDQEGVQL